jgi:hypothetical protein
VSAPLAPYVLIAERINQPAASRASATLSHQLLEKTL